MESRCRLAVRASSSCLNRGRRDASRAGRRRRRGRRQARSPHSAVHDTRVIARRNMDYGLAG